jgi:hypothetical protein
MILTMNKTVLSIDFSDICKDYNTVYLDRDNPDRETTRCMRKVMEWTRELLTGLADTFGYTLYHLNAPQSAEIDDVAAKRFLFYSLEKGITVQCFTLDGAPRAYASVAAWEAANDTGVLIRNDEDGETLFLHVTEGSEPHRWLSETVERMLHHA